jgi:hypothetical protein
VQIGRRLWRRWTLIYVQQTPSDSGFAFTSPEGQHDLGALHDRMRQGSGMGKGLQLLNLVIAENPGSIGRPSATGH